MNEQRQRGIARHQIFGRTSKDKELIRKAGYGDLQQRDIDSATSVDMRDTKENSHLTALHWAVLRRQVGNVDTLLRNGADLNALSIDGKTPFQYLFEGNTDPNFSKSITQIAGLLLRHGATPRVDTRDWPDGKIDVCRGALELIQARQRQIPRVGR